MTENHFISGDEGQSRPGVKWSDTDQTQRDREQEFMSRYEKVTAANADFTVFQSDLPGKYC